VGCDGVQQEPRPVAGGRGRQGISGTGGGEAREKGWTSDEHFTVEGTLLEAWASGKSFQPKDQKSSSPPDDPGNPTVNFHGEERLNQTHESKTDPDALWARKGAGSYPLLTGTQAAAVRRQIEGRMQKRTKLCYC